MSRSLQDIVPPGTILLWAGQNVPSNYLECNGSIYKQSDYLPLYNAIKDYYTATEIDDKVVDLLHKQGYYRYTTIDYATKYNDYIQNYFFVPDLRDHFPRGRNNNADTGQKKATGNASHSHSASVSGFKDHTHGYNNTYYISRFSHANQNFNSTLRPNPLVGPGGGDDTDNVYTFYTNDTSDAPSNDLSITVNDEGSLFAPVPENRGLGFIIKY